MLLKSMNRGIIMSRPTTKADLISSATENYEEMNRLIDSLSEKELSTPFEFDEKKKEAHWKRDKNLRDVLYLLHMIKSEIASFEEQHGKINETD